MTNWLNLPKELLEFGLEKTLSIYTWTLNRDRRIYEKIDGYIDSHVQAYIIYMEARLIRTCKKYHYLKDVGL